ncbi:MAG TPA: hypothetical protein DEB39_12900, partial [Planctomycetaceae bacterium]|nr:hypothetical protein [Planctomycetaceae bacterium]
DVENCLTVVCKSPDCGDCTNPGRFEQAQPGFGNELIFCFRDFVQYAHFHKSTQTARIATRITDLIFPAIRARI